MRKKDFKKISALLGVQRFPDATVVGAPTATHAAATATGAVVAAAMPPITGGIKAGDIIVAITSHKLQGCQCECPAGFEALKQDLHNNGSNGTDVGGNMITSFKKIADGTEGATITFNLPEPDELPTGILTTNVLSVVLQVIRPGSLKAKIDINVVAGFHRSYNETVNMDTNLAMKAVNNMSLETGDLLIAAGAANADTFRYINRALAAIPNLTISIVTQNFIDAGTSNGNDQYIFGSLFKVTAGKNSACRPQYNALSVDSATQLTPTSALRAPWIATHFIRIRQQEKPLIYRPSRFNHVDPTCIDDSLIDAQTGLWGSMRIDREGAGVTVGIESYLGELHFWIKNNFATYATELNRRGEVYVLPQQPRFVPGTKIFESWRMRSARFPQLPDQWISWQHHTGGFTGATSPNHPNISFEWAKTNQYSQIEGWNFGSGNYAPAGTLVLNINTIGGGVHKYVAFPSINYIGSNIDFEFATMIKSGFAGSGKIVLSLNGTIFYTNTTDPTIGLVPEDTGDGTAPTGTVAKVGGHNKINAYLHQLNTSGAVSDMKEYYDAYIAAGMTPEMKTYYKGFKRSVKNPTDFDYNDSYDAATFNYLRIL